MEQGKVELALERTGDWLDRHWKLVTVAAWLLFCAWFLFNRWSNVQAFALADTDDNLRLAQVRALLAGQDWFDLRQYRLNPPAGANVHWSRLVDLPIAGLMLTLRPFFGGAVAEKIAVAGAPLLPLLVLLFGIALTMRRLVDRRAYGLAFIALFFAGSATGMFMPLRIDHHGWQLALLSLVLAGLADPKRARGGVTAGAASALSLAIGLELLIYLALAGAAVVLFWVAERDQRRRAAAYALTLSGGTALGFLLFASYANRQPVCDALSPVWLSNALLGGALLFGAALLSPPDWKKRLALAAAAGLVLALFHALAWPHCLSRLEGVSPEVERLWLSRVREARPIHTHGWKIAAMMLAIPLTGILGWALLAWRNRRDPVLLRRTIAVAAPAITATLLLAWQTRTGPAAQMMGAIGAGALVATAVPALLKSRWAIARTLGVAGAVVVGLGAAVPMTMDLWPDKKQTGRQRAIATANARCTSLAGLRPVALQPKGMVFTFVDYGPRLIAVTHHSAVTGPYHRNGEQIGDVMKAFRGSSEQAKRIVAKYRSDYVLICPNSSTTTIFLSEAPEGFYGQLDKGEVPDWLEPVQLPQDSPFRMWRVKLAPQEVRREPPESSASDHRR
jgi:MFS family permease